MKLFPHPTTTRVSATGSISIAVLGFMLLATWMILGYLTLATHNANLTRRGLDTKKAQMAAAAGIRYGQNQVLELAAQYELGISAAAMQALVDSLPAPPTHDRFAYVTPGSDVAFKITVDTEPIFGTVTNGTLALGHEATVQEFTIYSGAYDATTGVGAVMQQQVRMVAVPPQQYLALLDMDLELLPGVAMDIVGSIHCNGDIYLANDMTFRDDITAHGNVYYRRKHNGATNGTILIEDRSNVPRSMVQSGVPLDSDHSDWVAQALSRWDGTVQSGAHGVTPLSLPMGGNGSQHQLIERPLDPTHPDYSYAVETKKLSSRAGLSIQVSSAGVLTATDFHGSDVTTNFVSASLSTSGPSTYAKAPSGHYLMDTNGSFTTDKTFVDEHEGTTIAPIDLYIDELVAAFPDLVDGTLTESQGKAIIYVTRDDPDGAGGQLPAVRIRNASQLPASGLAIATDLPLYVEGDFNSVSTKPALLASDATTLLSKNWQDSLSGGSVSGRQATETWTHAASMHGHLESLPAPSGVFNGGLNNSLRYLEQWTGIDQHFRGSIMCLWAPETAATDWDYTYYTVPNRDWQYDSMYSTVNPPGMTLAYGLENLSRDRVDWATPPWN